MNTAYAFTRTLDYASIVAASERVAWTVDEVLGERALDASKPIVPASWVGTAGLGFLTPGQQLLLNHCRAFSYAHLLGHYEEFIPIHLTGLAHQDWHADRTHLRALLRFGEEEMKHQQLFRGVETALERSCGLPFARHFEEDGARVRQLTDAILDYGPLPRFLMLLALEWGTQRHYVESVREFADVDPLYRDVLKAHWVEEAQHAKCDALELARLAGETTQTAVDAAFGDIAGIGRLVDRTIVGQAEQEIETLREVTGRRFIGEEGAALRDALYGSLRRIVVDVSLGHPSFAAVARELSAEGAARLGIQ
jgi:hypothetical protein